MRARLSALDLVWGIFLSGGVFLCLIKGEPGEATAAVIRAAEGAIGLTIGLVGVIALWTGLMHVAEEAGLPFFVAKILRPLLRHLFPSLPAHHPALGTIALSIGANLLGLGNASTPLGLRAMRELQDLNQNGGEPSDAQCTFLCFVMGGLTIIPSTVIALRAQAGSINPTACLAPTVCATLAGTGAALAVDRMARAIRNRRSRGSDRR